MNGRFLTLSVALIGLATILVGCGGANKAVEQTGMDLGQQLMGSFTDVGSILGSITDAASAEEAAPKLDAANADLDKIVEAASDASPETQASLSEIATAQIPGLKELTDKAYAIPGVQPVIQPSLDSMLTKFTGFM